jgi:polysaccharide deacetylase family protein (PEP-CTERM system associated)
MRHHFSVDVEEYFQVSAFEPFVARAEWDRFESRISVGLRRLLELLEQHATRATFFVLGWIAERHPALVKDISARGHEVASHGWDHRRVTQQSPSEFRESVRRSKAVLEGLSGQSVLGFRAPSFSITPGLEWALDILQDEGYRYDSSLFPIRRSGYGYPTSGRDPHWREHNGGRLFEVPPATLRRLGVNIPAGGGGYFRTFPYAVIRRAFLDAAERNAAGTFYIHPWEMDPDQPRVAGLPWTTRARHYAGLGRTASRVEQLLKEFRFCPIADHPELKRA